jgi:prepilin-type N-terminal cleavage/methylation domain-containing protein
MNLTNLSSKNPNRGFTLLELLLALTLASLVFVAVAMAIDLHLRTLDAGRNETEEAQLARAVMRRIADDLRGAVQSNPVDFSMVQAMPEEAASALGNLASEDDFAGLGLNQSGQGSGGASAGSASATGGSATGAAGGSVSGGSSNTGSTAGGAGTGTAAGATGTEAAGTEATASQEVAQSGVPAAIPGVRGGPTWLDIDVSHLPRPEEFNGVITMQAETSVWLLPSDIKTISYYLQPPDALSDTKAMTQGGFTEEAKYGGLVRRVLDRAAARTAYLMGDTTFLDDAGDVIAPEITWLQFQYFDGMTWVTEWDSETMGGLPVAIEIALGITPMRFLQTDEDDPPFGGGTDEVFTGEVMYRMVVRLPAARPIPPPEEETGLEETTTQEEPAP